MHSSFPDFKRGWDKAGHESWGVGETDDTRGYGALFQGGRSEQDTFARSGHSDFGSFCGMKSYRNSTYTQDSCGVGLPGYTVTTRP